jgi:molecular chaperone GrpE
MTGPDRPESGLVGDPVEQAADGPTQGSSATAPHGDPVTGAEPSPEPDADGATAEAEAADDAVVDEPVVEETAVDQAAADNGHRVVADLEELTAKAERAEEYLTLAQRTKADFENFRKRAAREAGLAQERGVAKLAKELLPAIDNLDRAVQAAGAFASATPEETAAAGDSQLASGIKLVHADVLSALARVGIEPFSPAGEAFDPQYHEAVAQHPVEGAAPGTVVEVYQQGYRIGETVLRPARVLVAA